MIWHLERGRRLHGPDGNNPLWASHAQAPTILPLSDTVLRIFFAGRDGHNISRVFRVDLALPDLAVVDAPAEPVLDIGPPGAFDCAGVGPGAAVRVGDELRLYYSGGAPAKDVPYRQGIGLAVSRDDGRTFERRAPEPVLGPDAHPLGVTTPTIVQAGGTWWMWHSRFVEWKMVDGRPEPVYDLACATSSDGLTFTPHPAAHIPLQGAEGGLVRPALVADAKGWRMLFAARGRVDFRTRGPSSYRLIAAQSADGIHFTRFDDGVRFDRAPAEGDWDFDMQSYPALVPYQNRFLLFYNGSDFGRDGFGTALASEQPD